MLWASVPLFLKLCRAAFGHILKQQEPQTHIRSLKYQLCFPANGRSVLDGIRIQRTQFPSVFLRKKQSKNQKQWTMWTVRKGWQQLWLDATEAHSADPKIDQNKNLSAKTVTCTSRLKAVEGFHALLNYIELMRSGKTPCFAWTTFMQLLFGLLPVLVFVFTFNNLSSFEKLTIVGTMNHNEPLIRV